MNLYNKEALNLLTERGTLYFNKLNGLNDDLPEYNPFKHMLNIEEQKKFNLIDIKSIFNFGNINELSFIRIKFEIEVCYSCGRNDEEFSIYLPDWLLSSDDNFNFKLLSIYDNILNKEEDNKKRKYQQDLNQLTFLANKLDFDLIKMENDG